MAENSGRHPCPVCGRTMFEEYDSYDICMVCGWEDDAMQEEFPDEGGGPNASLIECRRRYREKIAADPNYTWAKSCDVRSLQKGIFWIIDRENLENNEPFLFRIPVDCAGTPCYLTSIPRPNSKRGDNYNHKLTWYQHVPEELRRGKPYDWYPRGRVEIRRTGRATIYLNPDLATDAVISYITEKFNLQHLNVKVVADGSGHYAYYMDKYVTEADEGQS